MHDRCYAIIGARRSGIHLVADFVLSQFSPACIYNECPPMGNPGRQPANILPLGDPPADPHQPLEALGLIFEDHDLDRVANRTVEQFTGSARALWTLLVIRDPWNMLASRLKWQQFGRAPELCDPVRGRDLWLEYAMEATGRSSKLGDRKNGHVVPVLFNQFVRDDAAGFRYRRYVAGQLDLPLGARGIRGVPGFGGGSSWDRTHYDGRGHKMQVQDRWKQLGGDSVHELWRLTADPPALRTLALDLFGPELVAATWPDFEAFCHHGPRPPSIRIGSQLCNSPPSA